MVITVMKDFFKKEKKRKKKKRNDFCKLPSKSTGIFEDNAPSPNANPGPKSCAVKIIPGKTKKVNKKKKVKK